MKCPRCGRGMTEHYADSAYKFCGACKSAFKDPKSVTMSSNDINKIHIADIIKNFNSDLIHYSNKLKFLIDFFKNKNVEKIIDMGGGIPKLPLLIANDVMVVDINANKWSNIFPDVYNLLKNYMDIDSKSVVFINDNVYKLKKSNLKSINKFISSCKTAVISMIHLTEHLPFSKLNKFLDLVDSIKIVNKDVEIYGLIYGPNIERFKDKNWIHNIIDHFSLLHIDVYRDLISKYGWNIIKDGTLDEDFYIIFI